MAIRICAKSIKQKKLIEAKLQQHSDSLGNWMTNKGFDIREQKLTWDQVKARTVGTKPGLDGDFRVEHLQKIPKVIETAKHRLTRNRSALVNNILLPRDRAKDWGIVDKFNENIFRSVNQYTGGEKSNAASYRNFWKFIAEGAIKIGKDSRTNPLGKVYKNPDTISKVVNKLFTEYDVAQANGDVNLARELYEGNPRKGIVGINKIMRQGQGKIFKEVYDLILQPKVTTNGKLGYKEYAQRHGYTEQAKNAAEIWHTELHTRGIEQISQGIKNFRSSIANKRHLFGDLRDSNGRLLYDRVLKNLDDVIKLYEDGQLQKEGFYPIFSMEVLPSLTEASRLILHADKKNPVKDIKKGASVLEKIEKIFRENQDLHTKLRDNEISNDRASANIFYTLDAYSKNAGRFNMVTYNTGQYLKVMESLYKFEGTEMENKMRQMEDFIDHQYSIISGTRAGDNKTLNDITRAITSYQFFSKLGLNFRSAARNATQSLLNYIHFGGLNLIKSYRELQDSKMKTRVNDGLADNGILFADLKEGYLSNFINRPEYNIEKGIFETKKGLNADYLHKFADSLDYLAEKTGIPMQVVENRLNRKLTYKIGYSLAWKSMKSENTYHEKLFMNQLDRQLSKEAKFSPSEIKRLKANNYRDLQKEGTHQRFKKGDSTHLQFLYEQYLRRKANNAAVWATRELHYDYSATGKSQFMTTKPGAIMFQFQHFSMNYFNYQRKIARNYIEDLSSGLWNTPEGGRAFRLAMLYGVLTPLFEIAVPGGARFSNLVQNDTAERIAQLREFVLEGRADDFTIDAKGNLVEYDKREGRGSFYGKGPVIGLLGGPMISDLVTLNNLADLYDLDEDGWAAMLSGYQDYSDKTKNEKWGVLWKTINRGTQRIGEFFFGKGTFGSRVQSEFGLFPNQDIIDRRKHVRKWFEKVNLLKPEKKKPKTVQPRPISPDIDRSLTVLGRPGGREVGGL